jgi:hypothetical protein
LSRENELSFDAPKLKNNQKVVLSEADRPVLPRQRIASFGLRGDCFEALHEYGGVLYTEFLLSDT